MILPLLFLLTGSIVSADDNGFSFIFNDSQLVGVREIQPNGHVLHTNETQMSGVGHTFYSRPFRFKNSTSGDAFSFSISFCWTAPGQSEDASDQAQIPQEEAAQEDAYEEENGDPLSHKSLLSLP
ncbi:hypothetical protein L1987_82185 [Smallanthus sonchifolius]|uniref:Uncharacterized protein n=1 Tax=Smallanthus sonchifolius TaxID=185202 RepID=A0ACB8YB77_9ASTR|nr:hypothetical protein L1987_82185 [Smallanthus sonchifolius]